MDSESLKKHFAFLCFVYALTFITISLFAIGNNILILSEVNWYISVVQQFGSAYILTVYLLSIFINAQVYFYWAYRRYKGNPMLAR